MNVPIVFSFDRNLVFPAAVSICSLMMSAKPETHYDVYVLYGGDDIPRIHDEERILEAFPNLSIQYRSVGSAFSGAYEIRGITTPTYYRLLIPNIIPEYDKVIYADVDIIFRVDFSDLISLEMGSNLIGACYALEKSLSKEGHRYTQELLGLVPGEYFQAGVLLMNLAQMRAESMVDTFVSLAGRNLKFQDQDVMNIACANRIISIPWNYNMGAKAFSYLESSTEVLPPKYANADEETARNYSNIHYNGQKPWKDFCINFDIWWEYYRKSPIFNSRFYYSFFSKKLNYLDQLSLSKRIKLLIRYFTFGRVNN